MYILIKKKIGGPLPPSSKSPSVQPAHLEAHTTIGDMPRFMHMTFCNALAPSKHKSHSFVMKAHGLDHTSDS